MRDAASQDVPDLLENHMDPEDAFGAGSKASSFIVDHCSMSWSTDKCGSTEPLCTAKEL